MNRHNMNGPVIQWATQKDISKIFNVGRDKLNDLALNGYVRVTPLSNVDKSKKLYCCEDLDHYLKAKSGGRKPRVMRGRK